MALRDYITCADCNVRLIYDGYDHIRNALEEDYGDPDADHWTVLAYCRDHCGDGSLKFVFPKQKDHKK